VMDDAWYPRVRADCHERGAGTGPAPMSTGV
jgi:hypothetical protein